MGLPVCWKIQVSAALSALLLVLIFAAGCSSSPVYHGEKPPPPKILVDYQRTGGIAGFSDHMVVFDTGDVVYMRNTGSGTFTIARSSLYELGETLERANFTHLAPDYPAKQPGADYFFYSITYDGRTVTTETGGEPPELVPVIMRLDALLAEHS
jgi:hypothetical protein